MDVEALRCEHYNAEAVHVRRVTDDLVIVRARPDAGQPKFEPGQWNFAGLGLWEPRCDGCPPDELTPGEQRELQSSVYSLSSAILADDEDRLLRSDEEDWYEFYIGLDRPRAHGKGGAALAARMMVLEPGSRLFVGEAPQGKNTLSGVGPEDDVVFLATGTGEAPHNCMIAELLRRRHRGRVASVVTVRYAADLAYRDVHERTMRLFTGYRWHGVATRDQATPGKRLQIMFGNGDLEERTGIALDPERCHVFLCGNSGMVGRPRQDDAGQLAYPQPAGMIELLEQRGFRADPAESATIHFERY